MVAVVSVGGVACGGEGVTEVAGICPAVANAVAADCKTVLQAGTIMFRFGGLVSLSSLARIFGRMFNNSFPACAAFFFFFLKWRLARAH